MVYVREAHPAEGWWMESNKKVGANLNQPTSDDERCNAARLCQTRLDVGMPMLVDSIKDEVGSAYSGMPERMYVIDRTGRIAYKGGRGPFHFNLPEFEQSLILLLNQQEPPPASREGVKRRKPNLPGAVPRAVPAPKPAETTARFPALENGEAWSRMSRPPLPVWARILSQSLPRATAGMLRLDYVHRAQNPLDPIVRGKLRWVAANANRCEYSRRYAEADLLRAGMTKADLAKLAGDHAGLPAEQRQLLRFARKMTLAAHTVTDAEFAAIMKRFGPEKTVAVVHMLAQANFQDRIFLALGIQVEPDGPYPPLDVPFDPKLKSAVAALDGAAATHPSRVAAPKRSPWKSVLDARVDSQHDAAKPAWTDHDFAGVQKLLGRQQRRASRIPLPDWDAASKRLPPELRSRGPSKVIWSNVSLGYQPRLTQAWFNCMRTFREESDLDRVFANSMFWVVTRSNQCFY
jgi:Iodothyronine deiodinase